MTDLNKFIDALSSGDEDLANSHFNSVMNDKLQAALDNRKIEIAQELYVSDDEEDTEV